VPSGHPPRLAPLPAPFAEGARGKPRTYGAESLLLIALLRTSWRLSYQDTHEGLVAWPALARGLSLGTDVQAHVPSPSQMDKRGTPPCAMPFVVAERAALRRRLIGARHYHQQRPDHIVAPA